MMLANSHYSQPPNQHYATHAPLRPSPLAERSANAPLRFDFSMASQSDQGNTPTPQRAFKPNPLMQTRDAATKRRRDMFFKRVQNSRDDKKWESRGEQIQQLDFVSERKRWENSKAREAPPEDDRIMDEELMDSSTAHTSFRDVPQPELDMTEAEYLLAQEEYELLQLVASMEQEHNSTPQHYGSDEEDYDEIFLECMSADQYGQSQRQDANHAPGHGEDVDMDMDMTDG